MLFCLVIAAVLAYPASSSDPGVDFQNCWVRYAREDTLLKVVFEPKTYRNARATCMKEGGDLVKVTDERKAGFVSGLLTGPAIIGIRDIYRNGALLNQDETPVSDVLSWAKDKTGLRCVEMDTYGVLKDITCTTKQAFVCEKDRIPKEKGKCPKGWTPYTQGRKCLIYQKSMLTWAGAREACQEKGADLVEVLDDHKAEAVHDLSGKKHDIYIGLIDEDKDGFFTTTSGKPVSNAQAWWHYIHEGYGKIFSCGLLYQYYNIQTLVYKTWACNRYTRISVCEKNME